MTEKELKKQVTGKTFLSNVLLALKIVFDLLPQVLLVLVISSLFSGKAERTDQHGILSGNHLAPLCGSIACLPLDQSVYPAPYFKMIAVGIFISFMLKACCNYLAVKTAHDRAFSTLTELRLTIIEHLKKLNLGFFKKHTTGELTSIVEHDVEQIEIYLAHGLPEIMSATLLPVLVFIAMLFINLCIAAADGFQTASNIRLRFFIVVWKLPSHIKTILTLFKPS